MDEDTLKSIAAQLRQPQGEYGIQVGEKMNEGNLHINLYTIEALKLAKGDKLLEIGMGNGFFVKDILSADSTIKYAGCDFSEIMVGEARKRNDNFLKTGQVEFYIASAEKLPFDDDTFDKVFCINTIYFWNNLTAVLFEIQRVLKPAGELIIAIRPKSVMECYPFTKYGFNMFSREELIDLLSRNNFQITFITEKEEPDQDVNGEKIKVDTLLICARK